MDRVTPPGDWKWHDVVFIEKSSHLVPGLMAMTKEILAICDERKPFGLFMGMPDRGYEAGLEGALEDVVMRTATKLGPYMFETVWIIPA